MPCSFPLCRSEEDEVLNNRGGNPGVHDQNGSAGRGSCQGRGFPGNLIRMNTKPFLRLRAALTATLVLSLLVVLAGATVRATGSGMGCPDWPLCYGCWIPPVSVDQLPEDYAERYAVAGRPAEFDAVKTWIEYLNRLLGAATGVSMVVTMILSTLVWRSRPSLTVLSAGALLVLALVAWLGAKVVDTFLAPYAVTLHLLTAYTLLGLLLGAREIAARTLTGPRPSGSWKTAAALALVGAAFLVQWTLGIRTREEIEAWIWNHDLALSVWEALGGAYDLHKLTGPAVAAAAGVWAWLGWRRRAADPRMARLSVLCFSLVAIQGGVGLILWLDGLPAWAKPLHLAAATGAWTAWAAAVLHSFPSGAPRHAVL